MIKQRVLYVGIGGSGLDLGIELDAALKREICGLDGNELSRRGLAYGTNVLPPFVQQVYIDFAANAVASVTSQLGGNVRTITGIIPAISSYRNVAQSLRNKNMNLVRDWLPDFSQNEPTVNPLSAGAGQFPTVGRAALFQSIQSQGLEQTISGQISEAIASLSGSMGDLLTYTGGRCSTSLTVYVGFSVSGGTGSGLFYDVLMVLMDKLRTMMTGSTVVVIPTVLMPSTFDGVLSPVKLHRAKLNAATALADLMNLLEELPRAGGSSNMTEVAYPGRTVSLAGVVQGVEMPVLAVTTKTPGMDRADTVRMLASAIVTQVSLSGSTSPDGNVINEQTFAENLVNIRTDITQNPSNMLPRPLMPMVSASLTMPAKKIADITAKRLLAEAFTPGGGRHEPSEAERNELALKVLSLSGLEKLVSGDVFEGSYNLRFAPPANIKNDADLRAKVNQLKTSISSNVFPVIDSRIRDEVRALAAFDILEGVATVLGSEGSLSLPAVASAAQHGLGILQRNTPPGMTDATNATAQGGQSAGRRKKAKRLGFVPKFSRRLTAKEIQAAFDKAEQDFKLDVLRMWWSRWSEIRHMWMPSVNTGSTKLVDLSEQWSGLLEEASQSAASEESALAVPRLGVKDFVPTQGVSIQQALANIYSNTKNSLLAKRQISPQTPYQLVQSIFGQGKDGGLSANRTAVTKFRMGRSKHEFQETLLESLRSEIHDVFTHPVAGMTAPFRPLSSLLKQMVESPNADSNELQVEIGNLVPGVLVPEKLLHDDEGNIEEPSVNITYPGETDVNVENALLLHIFSSDSLREFMGLNQGASAQAIRGCSNVEIAAIGDSDTLTVNINLIGQLMFEHSEVCSTLQTWQNEVRNDQSIERLEWRQRLGYKNPSRLLSPTLGAESLRQLILGLWGGLVTVENNGSLAEPELLAIHDLNFNMQSHQLPRLHLGGPENVPLNGWSGLLAAFERLLIDLGTRDSYFQQQIVNDLLRYSPRSLTKDNVSYPPVIGELLDARPKAIAEARKVLDGDARYGGRALAAYSQVVEFWEEDFRNAWCFGSNNLWFYSLNEIWPLF
jgi:hypothetical protein